MLKYKTIINKTISSDQGLVEAAMTLQMIQSTSAFVFDLSQYLVTNQTRNSLLDNIGMSKPTSTNTTEVLKLTIKLE